MKTLKGWLNKLHEVNVSDRQAVALAVVSGLALTGLIVVWLAMSTRTALLSQQLEDLDARQTQLTDAINRTWTVMGEATAPRAMEGRARQLGFKPAEQIEYLVTTPESAVISATIMTTEPTGPMGE
jgi:hypothetical protein